MTRNRYSSRSVRLCDDFAQTCQFLAKLPVVQKKTPEQDRNVHFFTHDGELFLELIYRRVGVIACIASGVDFEVSGMIPRIGKSVLGFIRNSTHIRIRGQRLEFCSSEQSYKITMSSATLDRWVVPAECPGAKPLIGSLARRLMAVVNDGLRSRLAVDFDTFGFFFIDGWYIFMTLPAEYGENLAVIDPDFLRVTSSLDEADRVMGLAGRRVVSASGSVEVVCPVIECKRPSIESYIDRLAKEEGLYQLPSDLYFNLSSSFPGGDGYIGITAEGEALYKSEQAGRCTIFLGATPLTAALSQSGVEMARRVFRGSGSLTLEQSRTVAIFRDSESVFALANCEFDKVFGGMTSGRGKPN